MNPNLRKLPKGWEAILAEEYQAGASDVEVRARLKMTKGLWDSLMNDPLGSEFKEVVEFGRMLAKAWWFRQGRIHLKDSKFNANLWNMFMKNQYGFSDKTQVTTKNAEDMSQEEIDERIERAFAKYKKVAKL